MEECIGRFEGMVREDRLKQSLKEGKTHKAWGDSGSSNTSNKSKGTAIANLLFLEPTMITIAASRETSHVRIVVVSM